MLILLLSHRLNILAQMMQLSDYILVNALATTTQSIGWKIIIEVIILLNIFDEFV